MKKQALPIVVLLILAILAACAAPTPAPVVTQAPASTEEAKPEASSPAATEPEKATEAPAQAEPATPVRTDIQLAMTSDVGTMDPARTSTGVESSIKQLMFEALLDKVYAYDDTGKTVRIYVPAIAESWEFSEDFLELTFHLRPNVKFHNGDTVKASDVVFSINRFWEAPNGPALLGPYTGSEVVDESTVKLTFSDIYPVILDRLVVISIMSESFVNEAGETIADKPMGTGPFKLVEHKPMQSFEFAAFEDYWKGAARIKTVKMDILPDATAALMAFEAGKLDQMGIPSESVDRIVESGQWETRQLDDVFSLFMILNYESEPFGDVKVREAIAYGVNKENNVLLARDGQGRIADTFFNPELMVNATTPDNIIRYDLEKARELLAEAGYPNGEGFPEMTIKVISGIYDKSAQVLQQDFAEMGITLNIEVLETNAWVNDIINGNFDVALNNASMSDLIYPWGMFFESKYLNQVNMARVQDPAIDALFESLGKTMDDEEQKAIIKDIINYVSDNVVYIPLSYGLSTTASAKGLKFEGHPREVGIYDMYWEK